MSAVRKSFVKFVGIPVFVITALISEWSLRRYYHVAAEMDRGAAVWKIGWFEQIGRQVNKMALVLGEQLPASLHPRFCDFTIWDPKIMILVQILIASFSISVAMGGCCLAAMIHKPVARNS